MSAALKVVPLDAPPIDLRIDYAEDPLEDLGGPLARAMDPDYRAFLSRIPTIADPNRA